MQGARPYRLACRSIHRCRLHSCGDRASRTLEPQAQAGRYPQVHHLLRLRDPARDIEVDFSRNRPPRWHPSLRWPRYSLPPLRTSRFAPRASSRHSGTASLLSAAPRNAPAARPHCAPDRRCRGRPANRIAAVEIEDDPLWRPDYSKFAINRHMTPTALIRILNNSPEPLAARYSAATDHKRVNCCGSR